MASDHVKGLQTSSYGIIQPKFKLRLVLFIMKVKGTINETDHPHYKYEETEEMVNEEEVVECPCLFGKEEERRPEKASHRR